MKENNLLLKAEKSNQGIDLHFFTTDGDFIAQAYLKKINEDCYSMYSVLSRPKCGDIVFENTAMYMDSINSYFCGDLNGDYTSQSMKRIQDMSKSEGKYNKKDVSEYIDIDYDPHKDYEFFYQAFSRNPDERFEKIMANNLTHDVDIIFQKMKDKINDVMGSKFGYDEMFERAFESKDNKWINAVFPLSNANKKTYKFGD